MCRGKRDVSHDFGRGTHPNSQREEVSHKEIVGAHPQTEFRRKINPGVHYTEWVRLVPHAHTRSINNHQGKSTKASNS